ncbi:MAG: glycosyltransferase family 4 protein [Bacteroidales bacterium]
MKEKSKKVMMLATSAATQGGISSVVKIYRELDFWKQYHIKWLETHIDGSKGKKLFYAVRSFGYFILAAPLYDLIHIHLSEVPSMLRKFPFFLLSRLYGRKIVLHFHFGRPETTINSRFKRLYRYMFSKADRVIVLSPSLKMLIKEHLSLSGNIVVIYNPCLAIDKKTSVSNIKEPLILYAGVLTQRKGYADLLRAFAFIAKQYPDWMLVFAGTGAIEDGKQKAADFNISNQTRFAGWVSGKEKADLFSKASIFCLPSYMEGFPMAILDALAYGIPVVTTPVGGIPDIIRNQKNGLLFPSGDIPALSHQLKMLMSNARLRKDLSKQSRLMAETLFNPKTIEKQICTLYESVLTKQA